MRGINPSTPARAAPQAEPLPASASSLEPLGGFAASHGQADHVSCVTGDETKLRGHETIFGLREDIRKRALGN